MEGRPNTNFEYNAAYNNQFDLLALASALDNDGADKFFGMEPDEQNYFEVGLQNIKQEVMSPLPVTSPECNTTSNTTSEYSTPCSSVVKHVTSMADRGTIRSVQESEDSSEANTKTVLSNGLLDNLNTAMKSLRMSTLKRANTPARKSVKFDGLPLLITREKEHPMETRLDTEVNTPKINLRTRSVARFSEAIGLSETEYAATSSVLVSAAPKLLSPALNPKSASINRMLSSPEIDATLPESVAMEQAETATSLPKPVPVSSLVLNNVRTKPFDCDDRKRKASPLSIVQPVKYISMAEKLVRFQRDTPDRFHTMPRGGDFYKPKASRSSVPAPRCTVPQSPALQAKLRARPAYHPTREQIEEEELKEIRSNKVKAYPLNLKVFQEPKLGHRIERLPVTAVEPFKLTEIKKKALPDKPTFNFTARPVPKGILDGPLGLKEKVPAKLTNPVTPLFVRRYGTPKRTAPVIDEKNSEKVLGKQVIYHFGVPIKKRTPSSVNVPKRSTDIVPFSFEERDKIAQQKKEDKIKMLLEAEKKARVFHANPLPRSRKSSIGSQDENNGVVSQLLADGYAAKRQERIKIKLQEEEELLKTIATFRARPATVVHAKPFEVKKVVLPLQEICPFELNTERRAKEREEYEKVLKEKEDEMEENKKQMQAQNEMQELEEISRLRKEAVHKANPVRRFKTLEIRPSDKILTTPRSPFVKKN